MSPVLDGPVAWFRALSDVQVEVATVAAITIVAAILRLWAIDSVPDGLHGDEAWTGLDARRILDEGWIGVYVPSALGQPTGPLYWTAFLFTFLPETAATIRLSMAVFGIATIPVAYLAFRQMFDRTIATFAIVVLAGLVWHLHLSRIGFMVISWPFMEVAALAVLWFALRRRDAPHAIWLFAAAGAVTGLGVYTYNAYLLFVPVPFVALAWAFFPRRARPLDRQTLLSVGAFAVAALVFAWPLLNYIMDNRDAYEQHQRVVGVQHSEQWKDADGLTAKADIIWERAREWQRGLVNGDRPDHGDGLATIGHPVVDPVIFLLALAGLAVAVFNWRKPQYAVLIAAAVILPWGALLTVGDGLFRRTVGLAPFVAVLAAIPLAWLWTRINERGGPSRYFFLALVAAVPLLIGARATQQYFGPVQDRQEHRFVFPAQLEAASDFMADLPDGTLVYFYSGRWSFDYETRRFVAPDVEGVDRSLEFRRDVLAEAPLDFSADRSRPVAFVLLAPYLDNIDDVVREHPGGAQTVAQNEREILFRAYVLPPR